MLAPRTAAAVIVAALALAAAGAARADNAQIAGLQVALQARGVYAGAIDGVAGPETIAAVRRFQQRAGLVVDGKAGPLTRRALGPLGRPLLGRRPLRAGTTGWDVSVLQFLLDRKGLLNCEIDGRFGSMTVTAVKAFQRSAGLAADGVAGPATLAALARTDAVPLAARQQSARFHRVREGESLTAIATRYRTSVTALARSNRLDPSKVLLVGVRLRVPSGGATATASTAARPVTRTTAVYVARPGDSLTSIALRHGTSVAALASTNGLDPRRVLLIGARLRIPGASGSSASASSSSAGTSPSHASVRGLIDRWAAHYGVDARLARALGWMESGFQQHVVSDVGARGVMQLLPSTMDFVQDVLLGRRVAADTADGNVQLGVRLLKHLLERFGGDERLALAAWYQGEQAVRERGVFKVSEDFVKVVLALKGRV